MWKHRIGALIIIIIGAALGFFVYTTEVRQTQEFQLGLDLSGGVYLTYTTDTKNIPPAEVRESLDALRDVIERRINLFGISEASVQIEKTAFAEVGDEYRLVVELPGVTDVAQAVAMIGQTPLLEFKVQDENALSLQADGATALTLDAGMIENGTLNLDALLTQNAGFVATELTGQYLQRASVIFDPQTRAPVIALQFNNEGAAIFEQLTSENIGKPIAIYLDGAAISSPVVQDVITGGEAIITGTFTPEEAKTMVGRLNSGALPVPITLSATETIGPSLGTDAVNAGVRAGVIGFLVIALFLIGFYRLPGLVATIALALYTIAVLALFKYIPVTLTAAGIAGFVISIGVAVDANILIFERIKEEMKSGKTLSDAVKVGFSRAWLSIRDSNVSSILSAIILFWFGSSLIKGFALTLGIGVLVSMFSAIVISRVLLLAISGRTNNRIMRFLFSAGLSK